MYKFRVLTLAVASGLVAGFGFLLLGWVAQFGWGIDIVEVVSSLYIGYDASWVGGLIGGVWAFFDIFMFVILVGWVYALLGGKK